MASAALSEVALGTPPPRRAEVFDRASISGMHRPGDRRRAELVRLE
jgi:hypothetical protein